MFAMSSVGVFVLAVIALTIWIAIAFWPARVASRKGHSFFGYFAFSLVFFPLALLTAYLVNDKTDTASHHVAHGPTPTPV